MVTAYLEFARAPTEGEIWLQQFSNARCVQPEPALPEKRWDTNIVNAGEAFTIRGATSVGGEIVVTFATDGHERRVTTYQDYVYPSDVRLDPAKRVLWVTATGLKGGIFHEAFLYRYDLASRVGRSIEVARGALPAPCPIKR